MTYAENELHGHYVTARTSSRGCVVLAGPFLYRQQAAAYIESARRVVRTLKLNPDRRLELDMAGYGTARFTSKPGSGRIVGQLNTQLGLAVDPATGYLATGESVRAA